MRKLLLGVAILVLLGVLSGCGAKVESGRVVVPIRLDEAALRALVDLAVKTYAARQGSNPLALEVQQVTFLPPETVVIAMQAQVVGGVKIAGSAEMRFSVQDGLPRVEITRLEIPGATISEAMLSELNALLSNLLQEQVRRAGDRVTLREITVEADALVLKVEVQVAR